MEKTIVIDNEHSFKVDNCLAWMMIYKSQFGHDIVPEMMPFLGALSEMVTGLVADGTDIKDAKELMSRLDKETVTNMLVELSAVEFVSFLNICWAMAKCADPSIEEPIRWIKQFDSFPLDVIAPEVFGLAVSGVVSEKNLQRLQRQIKSLKPKKKKTKQTSSKSSQQASPTA